MSTNPAEKVVIIGAGACGLMCAIQLGFLGIPAIVLEHNAKPGAKILISGGGRCNYTNLHSTPDNFISENPRFAISALSKFTPSDALAFFESLGIYGAEKNLGQIFPLNGKASTIVSALISQCLTLGQEIICNTQVTQIVQATPSWHISTVNDGQAAVMNTAHLVIATGGLPVQQIGATDFALKFARSLQLQVVDTQPGLVPLTVTGKDLQWFAALSGNSVFCRVTAGGQSFEENILFTHWGLSGPAILQASNYWRAGKELEINFLPNINAGELLKEARHKTGAQTLRTFLQQFLSRRLTDSLASMLPADVKIASLSAAQIKEIIKVLHNFRVKPAGTKGYARAEVMLGGIDTSELHSKTLECRKYPGLYFGGECVDVTGWLGGYNFQWAWASGYAIAQAISEKMYAL